MWPSDSKPDRFLFHSILNFIYFLNVHMGTILNKKSMSDLKNI